MAYPEEKLTMLKAMQKEAVEYAKAMGLTVEELTDPELSAFGIAFDRQFVLQMPEREIVSMYQRHQKEILLGAMIAKAQMRANVEGQMPGSGRVGGPVPIRACFLGVGDDWEDAAPFSTGAPANWIHAGTSLLGGTAGEPVRIGQNAVFVVFGVGSLHPSPKIESIQFTIDGKTKPVIITGWSQKTSGLRVNEFDKAMIWKKGTTVLAKVFISAAYGSSADDYPYLIGAAYILEPALRILDAHEFCGTDAAREVYKVVEI